MHTVRPDKPIPPVVIGLLAHVDASARQLNLPYFIGGAFARDLLLVHVYGFVISRPTRDVDIGVAVRNWEEFDQLKASLVDTGNFLAEPGIAHRVRYHAAQNSPGVPLDIVPFQGVEESGSLLKWPPDWAVVMNVAGFKEALDRREDVRVAENLIVPVASLPAQTLLKLMAWLDRRNVTSQDAVDLLMLLRRYGDAGNADRLYGDRAELLANVEYDVERAGAILLGEDVRAIALTRSYEQVTSAFVSPEVQDALVTHVSSGVGSVDRAQALVDAFLGGFGTTNTK